MRNFPIFKGSMFSASLWQFKGNRLGQTFRCHCRQQVNRPWLTIPVADRQTTMFPERCTISSNRTIFPSLAACEWNIYS